MHELNAGETVEQNEGNDHFDREKSYANIGEEVLDYVHDIKRLLSNRDSQCCLYEFINVIEHQLSAKSSERY